MFAHLVNRDRFLDLNGVLTSVKGLLYGGVERLTECVDEVHAVSFTWVYAVSEQDGDEFAFRIIASFSASVSQMCISPWREGGTSTIGVHFVVVGVPS